MYAEPNGKQVPIATFYSQNRIEVGLGRHLPEPQRRGDRDGRPALLRARRRRRHRHAPRRRAHGSPQGRAGRLVDHAAVRQEHPGAALREQAARRRPPRPRCRRSSSPPTRPATTTPPRSTPCASSRRCATRSGSRRSTSKNQILQSYLNIALFGGRVYGVQSAAEYYFGVSAKDSQPAAGGDARRHPEQPRQPAHRPAGRARRTARPTATKRRSTAATTCSTGCSPTARSRTEEHDAARRHQGRAEDHAHAERLHDGAAVQRRVLLRLRRAHHRAGPDLRRDRGRPHQLPQPRRTQDLHHPQPRPADAGAGRAERLHPADQTRSLDLGVVERVGRGRHRARGHHGAEPAVRQHGRTRRRRPRRSTTTPTTTTAARKGSRPGRRTRRSTCSSGCRRATRSTRSVDGTQHLFPQTLVPRERPVQRHRRRALARRQRRGRVRLAAPR